MFDLAARSLVGQTSSAYITTRSGWLADTIRARGFEQQPQQPIVRRPAIEVLSGKGAACDYQHSLRRDVPTRQPHQPGLDLVRNVGVSYVVSKFHGCRLVLRILASSALGTNEALLHVRITEDNRF